MAIENTKGGTVITGEHIQLFALMSIASRLGLEITTGMKFGGSSSMLAANAYTGGTKRTKRGALRDLVAFTELHFPGHAPAPSVVKALEGNR